MYKAVKSLAHLEDIGEALLYCGGVPWSPTKSHDWAILFPVPRVSMRIVSSRTSFLIVSEAVKELWIDIQ
jgi:hypothetical protein